MGAAEAFLDGRVVLHPGDCREVLAELAPDSVDAVVTDPPYHLQSIVDRFGKTSLADDTHTSHRARTGSDGLARLNRGFMGQTWDGGDIAFDPEVWRAVARVLKPGGHLIAFSGTRTYHRMASAIDAAGFDIRDMLQWLYSSGFPKRREFLKPACEPICFARKPFPGTLADNVVRFGTGELNIDGCRVPIDPAEREIIDTRSGSGEATWGHVGNRPAGEKFKSHDAGRWPANVVHDGAALPEDIGRYFFSAKADENDRLGSHHPTVKPVDLMAWLIRLVTPAGGIVLDPFCGTGTTGEAAYREGCRAVLIEREPGYCVDVRRRMALVNAGPIARAPAKALRRPDTGPGPLFTGLEVATAKAAPAVSSPDAEPEP